MVDMNDKLHQLNVTYSSKEDRLLLRVTTHSGDEFRIWLTRRFTGLLFSILEKEMDKRGGINKLGTSDKTRQMFKAGAFEKKFEHEKTVNYPLGEQGFLAFGIKVSNAEEGNILLELLPEKGPGVTINLNSSLLYMMHNLLSQGVMKAEWQQQVSETKDQISSQVH